MIKITEKETKLLMLALNPAAPEGEYTNAAVAFVKSLRARNATEEQQQRPPPQHFNPFSSGGVHFTFSTSNGVTSFWRQ